MFEVTFGGHDSVREPMTIDAEEFIGVKSFKAKGKRVTNFDVERIIELEPKPMPESYDEDEATIEDDATQELQADDDSEIEPERSDDEIRDEITGQQRIF
jgi:topoisomerase-4 subunit A